MTPLFKKLNFKNQGEILVINQPDSFNADLEVLKQDVEVKVIHELSKVEVVEFGICFVTTQSEIEVFISKLSGKFKGDATVWISYPKSSSKKYQCEFNRDTGFTVVGKYGLEPVRQVAIDEDWSALRFRRVEYIKNITRRESYALTEEAKKRTTKKGE